MDDKKKKRNATLRVKKKETRRDFDEKSGKSSRNTTDQKEAVNLNKAQTQQKYIHQVLPLVFALLAFLLFVTLFIDLLCNPGDKLSENPGDHLMGVFGYSASQALLGSFGQMAFMIPLLFLNAAIFWKRWVQRGVQGWKLLLSFLLFLFSDILLHVIFLGTSSYVSTSDPKTLYAWGYTSYSGGFLGGEIGYFFKKYLNYTGSYIITISCIIAIALLLWDFSFRHFFEKLKLRRELRSSRVPSMSEQEAEAAGYKARLGQKMTKLVARGEEDEEDDLPPDGAVSEGDASPEEADTSKKKKKKEALAPIPIPKLRTSPSEDNRLFVLDDDEATAALPDPDDEGQKGVPLDIDEPKSDEGESLVDPIFPRTPEGKTAKKAPAKGQADPFDLFTCFPESGESATEEHAPLPPEVPLVTGNVDTTPIFAPNDSATPSPASPSGTPESFEPPIFRRVDMELKLQSSDEGDITTAPLPEEKPYVFPPISYLHVSEAMTEDSEEEIHRTMLELAETFQNFRVGVKEINYSCGPTVTRYEVTPAPGVRVRAITGLADDIALSLATSGVRMESNIPGKNAVGVEVPNKHRSTVYLRALIESDKFTEGKSRLTACLGVDIAGHPVVFDIASMPHLLIAGTTGSGKSVCINSIILSLLYKARPDEVKLVLIDPKKVEFSIYRNIPHLLAPIVTTPKDAAGALQAAVEEMERRFEIFSEVEVPDLKRYNAATKNDPDKPFLPQIVIIIDELADLMMTAPTEVEEAICRIAQKARAAGIHLIVGTQRPSVDVVTGLIKSNIPSRIAFTVSSQVDSRTILDTAGAEKLTGKGDMLFSPIGATHAARVQGTFVSDDEIRRICDFVRTSNGLANYDENFMNKLKELAARCGLKKGQTSSDAAAESEFGDSDVKYTDAVRIAVEEKKISTSLLQRKLQIGYSRAAKLIDRMEAEGIVSPPDGSKPRSILITPEEYLDRFVNVLSQENPADSEEDY